jgi:type II pantothenate kinase
MNNLQNRPIVGIDRGASFTDFGVVESERLIEAVSLEKRDWKSIGRVYAGLIKKHRIAGVVFTGSVAGMPADLKEQVQVIQEIEAIGFGGASLAGCLECIVVSMGTGTAVVHFSGQGARHMGGTGVGGGTIKGLSSLMCNLEDPAQVEARALKGNAAHLNLTISDLGYESISFLDADMTASNFAAIKSRRVEDLAAAILTLVGETVGIIASLCAREANCRDKIVMVGKVAQNQYIRNTLNLVGKLYQTTFIFPKNPEYATVYGAIMKYRHQLSKLSE